MRALKAENLRQQAYQALLDEISTMQPGENRLPSEEELSRTLQISRTTIREVMQLLVGEGYVTRRHGKGNFGHPSATRLPRRIDLSSDFLELLGTPGQPAACRVLHSAFAAPSQAMLKRFPACPPRVYSQNWLYTQGEKPMIFCQISVPESLLAQPPQPAQPSQHFSGWLAGYCQADAAYYSVHLGCQKEGEASAAFGISAGFVLPNWQEIVYDIHDEPIAFCNLFFHPENAEISMAMRF